MKLGIRNEADLPSRTTEQKMNGLDDPLMCKQRDIFNLIATGKEETKGTFQEKGRRKSTSQGEAKKEKLRKILFDKLGIDNVKQLILRSENKFDKEYEHRLLESPQPIQHSLHTPVKKRKGQQTIT